MRSNSPQDNRKPSHLYENMSYLFFTAKFFVFFSYNEPIKSIGQGSFCLLAEWEGNHLLSTYYLQALFESEYRFKIGKAPVFVGFAIQGNRQVQVQVEEAGNNSINQQARLFQIMINNIYVLRKFSKN